MKKFYKPLERAEKASMIFKKKTLNVNDDLNVKHDDDDIENVEDYWNTAISVIGNNTIDSIDDSILTDVSDTLFDIKSIRKSIRGEDKNKILEHKNSEVKKFKNSCNTDDKPWENENKMNQTDDDRKFNDIGDTNLQGVNNVIDVSIDSDNVDDGNLLRENTLCENKQNNSFQKDIQVSNDNLAQFSIDVSGNETGFNLNDTGDSEMALLKSFGKKSSPVKKKKVSPKKETSSQIKKTVTSPVKNKKMGNEEETVKKTKSTSPNKDVKSTSGNKKVESTSGNNDKKSSSPDKKVESTSPDKKVESSQSNREVKPTSAKKEIKSSQTSKDSPVKINKKSNEKPGKKSDKKSNEQSEIKSNSKSNKKSNDKFIPKSSDNDQFFDDNSGDFPTSFSNEPKNNSHGSQSFVIEKIIRDSRKNKISPLVCTKSMNTAVMTLDYLAYSDDFQTPNSFSIFVIKGKVQISVNGNIKIASKEDLTVIEKDDTFSINCLSKNGAKLLLSYAL